LAHLLRRDLLIMRSQILQWHNDAEHTDDAIVGRLLDTTDTFGAEDAAVLALSTSYHRSLGLADSALILGDANLFETALASLEGVITSAAELGNIPTWWVATLTRHLLRDLWEQSLNVILPFGPNTGAPERWTQLRRDFIAQLGVRRPPHIDLWPSQVGAARRAIDPSDDLVIALPTSAGKTRIAELCILRALADQKRVVYVTPLRALSAQVERILARTFVPLGAAVTSLYGASGALVDTKTLASAEIVVATPEKLDFALRQDPDVLNDVALIVFDEGHMIGLGSREIRYEVLIQRLLRREDADERRIVCLSAMFNPDDDLFKDFGQWLRSDAPGDFVHVQWRPTRQRFATLDWRAGSNTGILSFLDEEKPYVPRFVESTEAKKPRRNPFPQNDKEFCICAANAFARDGHTVLVYSPQRSLVEPLASEFRKMSGQGFLSHIAPPKPEHMAKAKAIGREWLGESHAAMRALEIGVGTHHGALPRPFLNAIEELLNDRRLAVVVASPTLAQGIDLACSVLIFRSLRRYEDGEWVPISPAEFSNVVGRAGRAYVDLDGIAVLPTFDGASRAQHHHLYEWLIKKSRGQRLISGLAQLIAGLSKKIAEKLGVNKDAFLEYVLNQHDLWADERLATDADGEEDEEEVEDNLESRLSDLDLAVFSLVEPLETPVDELAAVLDDVLKDSLWKRTLGHVAEGEQELQSALLRSRAQWLWVNTPLEQRKACFFAGLGRKSGLFIYEQIDNLVGILATFQSAVIADDADAVAGAAVAFANEAIAEPFFSVRKLPENWDEALMNWVKGVSFSEILSGRSARDAARTQAFIQDGVVFKLVWAAEATRVQAIAIDHPRKTELGDGPAFVLTYGVPIIPAALLCQIGFASRVGSVWVARELGATFTENRGLNSWLSENDAILSDADFWQSPDHYEMWRHVARPSQAERPQQWNRREYDVRVNWTGAQPRRGSVVRIIPGAGRTAAFCAPDLSPLGVADLRFNPHDAALEGRMGSNGSVRVNYFGSGG
jgi:superfamily II DNA/RNA helicase